MMIKNYLKIAWRNLLKERQFTLLNLIGLSTGLACTLLIYLWVNDELHVDHYNDKDGQLFQIMANHPGENGIKTINHTPGLLAGAIKQEMPEVEYATTVVPASWFGNKGVLTTGDKHLKVGGQFVSQDYFKVFTCPLVQGDAQSMFRDDHVVGITSELAQSLFGGEKESIGKTFKWDHGEFSGDYHIGFVFEKNPSHAVEQFDVMFSFDLFVEKRPGMKNWETATRARL